MTDLIKLAEECEKAGCEDCGRDYSSAGFPDMIIPNDVWRRISTTGDLSGLLCPSCIIARVAKAGMWDVPAAFMSGPVRSVTYDTMYALRRIENLEEGWTGPNGRATTNAAALRARAAGHGEG